MASTTFAAIRDSMITLVEALTPTLNSAEKFRVARDEMSFVEWVESASSASFRRFTMVNNHDTERTSSTGLDSVEEIQSFDTHVAYPKHLGKYGTDNRRDMDDLIESDRNQIVNAIGLLGCANYTSGLFRSEKVESAITEYVDAMVLTMTFEIQYCREGI